MNMPIGKENKRNMLKNAHKTLDSHTKFQKFILIIEKRNISNYKNRWNKIIQSSK